MKAIATTMAPAAIGPYSQGVDAGVLVFSSGQLPINAADGTMPEGIKDQTRQSLANVKAVLEAGGSDMSKVVKTTVLLADIALFGDMNEVYKEFFTAPYPARSAFAVRDLPKGALVEIEAIAVK